MNKQLIKAIESLEFEKGIPKEKLIGAVETALAAAIGRDVDAAPKNVEVKIDPESGETSIFEVRKVVEVVTDPDIEVAASRLNTLPPGAQVEGDVVRFPKQVRDFGRIAAQIAKQVIMQKVREAEKEAVQSEYSGRVGEMVTGLVIRSEPAGTVLDLGRAEGMIFRHEQIPQERLRYGDRVCAYVIEVAERRSRAQVVLSRAHPGLIRRLFESSVAEVGSGIVEIKDVERIPGQRTKMSVLSHDPSIDAVGACVGVRGARVQTVIRELKGELIDVVNWDPDIQQYIRNALVPAKVLSVEIDEEKKTARVVVPDSDFSQAVGRRWQNVSLASRLTGYSLQILKESLAREEEGRRLESLAHFKESLVEEVGLNEEHLAVLEKEGLLSVEAIAVRPPLDLAKLLDIKRKLARAVVLFAQSKMRVDTQATEKVEEVAENNIS
ncbi:MAG: transcription termination/antitermination protein NusA [Candidatus Coatesbacteria bacterium]|nr:MAG: transcription termination/antitermination protein NusA [Candidatus Coatesbacteria bacterium]